MSTYTLALAEALAGSGHDIDIYCPRPRRSRASEPIRRGVTLYRLALSRQPKRFPQRLLGLVYFKLIRRIARRALPRTLKRIEFAWSVYTEFQERHAEHAYDIVEASDWGGCGLLISRYCNDTPVVVRLHRSLYFFRVDNRLPFTLDHRISAYIEKIALLRADAVTSPTEFMLKSTFEDWLKRDLAEYEASKPIRVIRNGIHTLRDAATPKAGEPYLCCLGRLEPAKGTLTLLKAFRRVLKTHPAVRLLLCGADTAGFSVKGRRLSLKEFLERHPVLNASVDFKGQVHDARTLREYMTNALICLVPSEGFENMPYTILEAMALAKPVVVSDTGGLPEIIEHGKSGLIHRAGDSRELADRIRLLLEDDSLRFELSRQAYLACDTRFSADRTTTETVAFYARVRQHSLTVN